MELNKDDKISILLETLKQRHGEIEELRKSAFQIVTWTIGVFLLLTGWIIQRTQPLTVLEKALLVFVICFSSGILMWFLRDMEGGFKRQFEVINKIQSILGLYKIGYFQPDESLLPQSWAQRPRGGFFKFIKFLLLSTSAIVIVSILISGIVF